MTITAATIQVVHLDDAHIIAQADYPAEDADRIIIEVNGEFHAYVTGAGDRAAIRRAVADVLGIHHNTVSVYEVDGPFYASAAWDVTVSDN